MHGFSRIASVLVLLLAAVAVPSMRATRDLGNTEAVRGTEATSGEDLSSPGRTLKSEAGTCANGECLWDCPACSYKEGDTLGYCTISGTVYMCTGSNVIAAAYAAYADASPVTYTEESYGSYGSPMPAPVAAPALPPISYMDDGPVLLPDPLDIRDIVDFMEDGEWFVDEEGKLVTQEAVTVYDDLGSYPLGDPTEGYHATEGDEGDEGRK